MTRNRVQWREIDPCPAVNPDTNGQCEFEAGHDQPHVHTEWYLGEIQGPVWWYEAGLDVRGEPRG